MTLSPFLKNLTLLAVALVAGTTLLMNSTVAHADEFDKMREKIQQYKLKLADLEKADEAKGANQEIALCELWLSEAQAQIAKEEEDEAKKQLRRVEIAIPMIEKLIVAAKEEKKANDRESAAIKIMEEANEAKIKLEQAEARKKQLQSEMTPK